MQKVQAYGDDNRSGSGVSDFSNLDNDTDTLGRAILRHERDARRIQTLLHGSQPNFDRRTSRIALSSRLQDREQQVKVVDNYAAADVRTRPFYDAEPGLNVPRAWGRKTRSDRNWIRASRIPVTSETHEKDVVIERAVYTDWEEQDVEQQDTPPSMRRRRQLAQPTSLRTMNPRLKEVVKANEGFSDLSLIASTPAVQSKPIASRRLIPLPPPSNAKILPRTLRPPLREIVPDPQPEEDPSSSSDKENVAQHKSRRPLHLLQSGLTTNQASHHRDQISPLYNRDEHGPAVTTSSRARPASLALHGNVNKLEGRQGQVAQESRHEPPTPMVTGGWIDTPKINKQFEVAPASNNILPRSNITSLANIASEAMPPQSVPSNDQNQQRPRSETIDVVPLDKPSTSHQSNADTVLSSQNVIMDGKDKIGAPSKDSEDKIDTVDYVVINKEALPQAVKDKLEPSQPDKDKVEPPQAEKDIHTVATKALSKHIEQAVTTMKDIVVARAPRKQAIGTATKQPSKSATPRHVLLDADGRTTCEHCGGLYHSVWRGLWVEFRSNFWVRDPTAIFGIRLTLLGTIISVWLCWLFVETTLCWNYCHPKYAVKMVGYGVDLNAPEFPFVLPTLFFRPFGFVWRPALKWLSWATGVSYHYVTGNDLYPQPRPFNFTRRPLQTRPITQYKWPPISEPVKWWKTAATATASSSRRAVESAIDAVDDIGRML